MNAPPPPAAAPARWSWRALYWAPHRLAFALACVLLILSSLWWLNVQLVRSAWLPEALVWPLVWYPSLVHGAVMTYGFVPLFFLGFLYTAGPRWLGIEGPTARQIAPGLWLQGLGWCLWLLGAQLGGTVALVGGALAWLGLCAGLWRLLAMLRQSRVADQVHARLIAGAWGLGLLCLAGMLLALAWDQPSLARAWLTSGLWGFVVVVYVTVAHRMIPFFTSSALPMISIWSPLWVLLFLLLAIALRLLMVWVEWLEWELRLWAALGSFWLLVSGMVLLGLAFVWGLVQSLRIRLLAMLHIGFLWLGLAFLIDSIGHFWMLLSGDAPWTLGAMHAITMGFMGSLLLAMVTRVSCGHSGRTLVADRLVWGLFWLLQLATVLRVVADLADLRYLLGLTLAAALLWTLALLPWALRMLRWYGLPRVDGRPG